MNLILIIFLYLLALLIILALVPFYKDSLFNFSIQLIPYIQAYGGD